MPVLYRLLSLSVQSLISSTLDVKVPKLVENYEGYITVCLSNVVAGKTDYPSAQFHVAII